MADFLVQEDGSSKIAFEDGTGDLLLESSAPVLDPSFIASATVLHAPTLAYTDSASFTNAGTFSWLCPNGITLVEVSAYGGGGGGAGSSIDGGGGGGGGAFARRVAIPVTPGTIYTFVVGAAGAAGADHSTHNDGGSSSFTGDSGVQVIAVGGTGGLGTAGGAGGLASSSTGDSGLVFSGGTGGTGQAVNKNGGGGGASGNVLATGANGGNASPGVEGTGGAGANGGGSGGNGNTAGNAPGGGAGGTGGGQTNAPGLAGGVGTIVLTTFATISMPAIGSVTAVYAPAVSSIAITPPFITSVTAVYTPALANVIYAPFISSVTAIYAPALPEVNVGFISSHTVVYAIMSVFDPNKTYGGPGNGGEAFLVELNANGVTTTATLAADIGVGMGALTMTGDSGLPTSVAFVVTIDSEQIYVFSLGGGNYQIHGRGLGNTTIATHTAGTTVSWGDSYDQAIVAIHDIAHEFVANINSTGSTTYPGWLISFDSSQAYLSGSRYPMHVSEMVGVFAAGAGVGGTNRCDASQPNAITVPAATSDDCPAALSNPSRINTDITAGDVAVVRYTNPEATVLDLGPRAVSLQSWFGLKRVDTTDHDVTFTDPTGICVDTTGAQGTFTGSVEDTWLNPSGIGIGPDTGLPTPNNVPWTTVTLPGTDRKMTYGVGGGGYNEKGWPMCCLAVRQGNRRVPFWQSWDWRDYRYVYTGFGTDATYAQILINRNGIVFTSVPAVEFPGPQDIDGPDAVWDDATYYFAAAWYVIIFSTPYLVFGPGIGGLESGGAIGSAPGVAPGVSFIGGGTVITLPPFVEGGSGGGINPGVAGLHVWGTSGKGFS